MYLLEKDLKNVLITFLKSHHKMKQETSVPEIIDPVFTKTSPKRSFCMTENERFGLVFTKTGSINSGTESETGVAEKSRWDQANSRQKPGLVWRNRKKISQITKDYFYLPFFLLIIL